MTDYQIANLRAELLKKIENSGGADISALAAQVAQLALDVLGLSGDVTTLQGTVATKADQADIAPGFSDATNYSAGDIVFYNGDLYRFTVDHSAGAWVGGDAALIDVSIAIDDLKPINSITSGSSKAVTSGAVFDAFNALGSSVLISTLWTNSDPTLSFPAQDVTLSSDLCNYILVIGRFVNNYPDTFIAFAEKNGAGSLFSGGPTNSGSEVFARDFTMNSTTLSFMDAYKTIGNTAKSVANTYAIPYKVLGITLV